MRIVARVLEGRGHAIDELIRGGVFQALRF
jgi:hypothetical protein